MRFNFITSNSRCRAGLVGFPHPTSDVARQFPVPLRRALKVMICRAVLIELGSMLHHANVVICCIPADSNNVQP
jgi:hypothetical protein